MSYASCNITIDRSVSEIYEFLLDGQNNPLWRPGILDIKQMDDLPIQVGTIFKQGMRGPRNTRISADYQITSCVEDKEISFEVITGPYLAKGRFQLLYSEGQTSVVFSMEEESDTDNSQHLQRVVDGLKGLQNYFSFISVEHMVLIGSTGRNSGKTTLAVDLLQVWKNDYDVIGLKVTTIHEEHGSCPRGGEGCGTCGALKENFEIVEETNRSSHKDTSLLLASGAKKVYWLKAKKNNLREGITQFLSTVDERTLIICESNSLRQVVSPGLFIMLETDEAIKTSAKQVMKYADWQMNYKNKTSSILKNIVIKETQNALVIEQIKEAF